ncbi:MAG: hypothetical protein L7H18_00260 [Candidatus Nealsonbacteria bacterium DGGOD1a]|jgi:Ca2+/Na+ antiporter|nr:MAG: hypothetical protein L7H18_00260 [Candidatus Nealsonbacteria bacterium DGGOD1a]
MFELLIWSVIFIVAAAALIKAADWLAAGAQRLAAGGREPDLAAASIALALPELALALAAVTLGLPELVVPLAVGSTIANILLVAGASVMAAKGLPVKKEYIDLDAPLLAAAAAIFFTVACDGEVNRFEGLLMAVIFFVYTIYIFSRSNRTGLTPRDIITPAAIASSGQKLVEAVGARFDRGFEMIKNASRQNFFKALFLSLAGAGLLVFAANVAIKSLISVAAIIQIFPAMLAMTVLAAATSLPELFSSLATIRRKRYEMSLGNVFASNTVNLLLVCGVAAMFLPLPFEGAALTVGLPFLAISVGLLIISSFSRKINFGEGIMFLFLYFLFIVKIFNLF